MIEALINKKALAILGFHGYIRFVGIDRNERKIDEKINIHKGHMQKERKCITWSFEENKYIDANHN